MFFIALYQGKYSTGKIIRHAILSALYTLSIHSRFFVIFFKKGGLRRNEAKYTRWFILQPLELSILDVHDTMIGSICVTLALVLEFITEQNFTPL